MKTNPSKRPAIFLDRDGTIVEEVNYLSRVEDMRLFPDSRNAISRLKQKGYRLIVVTNQSGIGRGIYGEDAMHEVHDAIQQQHSGAIDAFYFCPHLPNEGCDCRKPGLGMIEAAEEEFEIDRAGSWMVGDKKIDVETGQAAGIRTIMVMTGYGREHIDELTTAPDLTAKNLKEAADLILDSGDLA